VTLALGLGLLALALIGLGIAEHMAHARKLAAIPIRIHVNGTRGKSSIVRLIAAALRAHGIQVYAKTTGSLPRVITTDGSEFPIHRPGLTNVIEQRRIIGIAAEEGAEAIVLECMALQPALQSLCELKMIRSTHGVISNARPDHLDVMGPAERDVALALLGTCGCRCSKRPAPIAAANSSRSDRRKPTPSATRRCRGSRTSSTRRTSRSPSRWRARSTFPAT
jgi:poly-gamma-glutamate synthase PgsB/CapB